MCKAPARASTLALRLPDSRGLTVVSMLRFLRKFWVVAVLEVPDSPTSTTGRLIFTICSSSQLARVVSTVGTEAGRVSTLARQVSALA